MYKHKNGISIKKIDVKDAKFLWNLKNNFHSYYHKLFWSNLSDQQKWIESIDSNKDFIFVFLNNNIKIGVGLVLNIDWISKVAQVSGTLAKKYHQSDITRKSFQAGVDFCFEIPNLHRLEAEVSEINIASLKMELKYLGFKLEGVRRKNCFKAGNYYDSYALGILKEEWCTQDRIQEYNGSCFFDVDMLKENKNKSKEIFHEMFNINDLF